MISEGLINTGYNLIIKINILFIFPDLCDYWLDIIHVDSVLVRVLLFEILDVKYVHFTDITFN